MSDFTPPKPGHRRGSKPTYPSHAVIEDDIAVSKMTEFIQYMHEKGCAVLVAVLGELPRQETSHIPEHGILSEKFTLGATNMEDSAEASLLLSIMLKTMTEKCIGGDPMLSVVSNELHHDAKTFFDMQSYPYVDPTFARLNPDDIQVVTTKD